MGTILSILSNGLALINGLFQMFRDKKLVDQGKTEQQAADLSATVTEASDGQKIDSAIGRADPHDVDDALR